MSIGLISAVFRTDLPAQRKLILIALADNANDDGYCWPSQATIGAKASISPRNLRTHIQVLESEGWLQVVSLGNGRGRATEYMLNTARLLSLKADPQPEKGDAGAEKGDARIPPTVIEPSLLQPSETEKAPKPDKKRITDECRQEMARTYPDLNEAEEYEGAVNHVAYRKAINGDIYYRRWMKRAEQWRKERQQGGNRGTSRRTPRPDHRNGGAQGLAGRSNVRVIE